MPLSVVSYETVGDEPTGGAAFDIGVGQILGYQEHACGAVDLELAHGCAVPDNALGNFLEPGVLIVVENVVIAGGLGGAVAVLPVLDRIAVLVVDLDTVLGKGELVGGIEIEYDGLAFLDLDLEAVGIGVVHHGAGHFKLGFDSVAVNIDSSVVGELGAVNENGLALIGIDQVNVLLVCDELCGSLLHICDDRLDDALGHILGSHLLEYRIASDRLGREEFVAGKVNDDALGAASLAYLQLAVGIVRIVLVILNVFGIIDGNCLAFFFAGLCDSFRSELNEVGYIIVSAEKAAYIRVNVVARITLIVVYRYVGLGVSAVLISVSDEADVCALAQQIQEVEIL